MANKQIKSRKIVNKAVGSFTTALESVEKANVLLNDSIEQDRATISVLKEDIAAKEARVQEIEREVLEKEVEIDANALLADNLRKFTK